MNRRLTAAALLLGALALPAAPALAKIPHFSLRTGKTCTLFYAPQAPCTTITGITVGLCGSVVDLQF
jgi:hypothetical protein